VGGLVGRLDRSKSIWEGGTSVFGGGGAKCGRGQHVGGKTKKNF